VNAYDTEAALIATSQALTMPSPPARTGPWTRTVPDGELDAAVEAVVGSWCLASPQGLRETKALLNQPLLHRIDELGEQVAVQSARLFGSDEARAAMRAFLERRAGR
jgi:enoyl-CoA hydratase/methylglutaconyl-CoA hydratase